MTRSEIAALIAARLKAEESRAAAQFEAQSYFVVDDLLPEALAHDIYGSFPDPSTMLYAGGISLMATGHYLHPHIDNSHDMERQRYRILNLLYYASPEWDFENGGNLELWPNGAKAEPHAIHSKFNRLAVIATNRNSWHSVSKVLAARNRTCVSNYYFSRASPVEEDYFHVTSFRGRPEEPVRDLMLRTDAALRSLIRKIAPDGLRRTRHYYKKGK